MHVVQKDLDTDIVIENNQVVAEINYFYDYRLYMDRDVVQDKIRERLNDGGH